MDIESHNAIACETNKKINILIIGEIVYEIHIKKQ